MRLQISKTKNAASLYIVKSTYDRNGARSNKIVKKLGTYAELSKKYDDPVAWGKQLAREMTEQEKSERISPVTVQYDPSVLIENEKDIQFNVGYLFLQKIYHQLKLNRICEKIQKDHKFDYDLNEILKALIYGRIIYPGSKKKTYEESRNYLETPKIEQHQIYRALSVLAEESDNIQTQLYKNSKDVLDRNDRILYYDCTNYFFEIEEEKGNRKYGPSKEHRPNPIVGMGLFMDGDGIPLAFCTYAGNESEQPTLIPLEKKIIHDFGNARFVVCTDAGLSSAGNRLYNSFQERAFITVQSLKKMDQPKREWALDAAGWHINGTEETYDLDDILDSDELTRSHYYDIFYKEHTFMKDGVEQRYIVSYSIKYRDYLKKIRKGQVARAKRAIENGTAGAKNANDPKRFIDQLFFDDDGTISDHSKFVFDEKRESEESRYDGFYCIATNLSDNIPDILKVNSRRWEIEESFRIMKTDFSARPVYLQRDERIHAHFLTCFIALYIYRILEKELGDKFTTENIISTLRGMNCVEVPREGYIPSYRRTSLTDALHEAFGFHTDYQILTLSESRKIFRQTKKC